MAPWPPSQCTPLSEQDVKLLAAVGVICDKNVNNVNKINNATQITHNSTQIKYASSSLQLYVQTFSLIGVLLTTLGLY